MLKKVKNWLGIEGVKLELALPQELNAELRELNGLVRLSSQHPQTVEYIKIVLIERYQRGRGEDQLTDEYELGTAELHQQIRVPAEGTVEIPFRLPFVRARSGLDKIAGRNVFYRGLAGVAKWAGAVASTYRVEAEAKVVGVALNPFDKQAIQLRAL